MHRSPRILLALLLSVLTAIAVGGCAGLGAEPWERDLLAEPGMQIDPDVIATALDEHIYFSKEASTGGLGTEYAVDRVARVLDERTDVGMLVNFGGGLRVVGSRAAVSATPTSSIPGRVGRS